MRVNQFLLMVTKIESIPDSLKLKIKNVYPSGFIKPGEIRLLNFCSEKPEKNLTLYIWSIT
jgi:hypothetical protein